VGNSSFMRVLVTGASGFVGRILCRRLLEKGFIVRACVRRAELALLTDVEGPLELCYSGDIAANPDWEEPLEGVDAVVHLAARVHVTEDHLADPLSEYMRTNVLATKRLAEAASRTARRFVFVSSVKVNGERTERKPFDEDDIPNPQGPYAISKWDAEQALRCVAANSGMELVIVRPPLVYGPGVRANFLRLMDLVYRGLPVPLPHALNRRSMIGVENLADMLVRCVGHPAAPDQTFLVSDGKDISTRELAAYMANAFGRPCRFLPFPEVGLRFAAWIMGKSEEADRLLSSLALNCRKARERLDWTPPVSVEDGLLATARWYIDSRAQAS
jgi:nucleoside-diphosphate-sugar epimerase